MIDIPISILEHTYYYYLQNTWTTRLAQKKTFYRYRSTSHFIMFHFWFLLLFVDTLVPFHNGTQIVSISAGVRCRGGVIESLSFPPTNPDRNPNCVRYVRPWGMCVLCGPTENGIHDHMISPQTTTYSSFLWYYYYRSSSS